MPVALGSQGARVPDRASTAARLLRTTPRTLVNFPPKYTLVLSSDTVMAEMADPLSGPGLKPGSTLPSLWTAASLLRACPPTEVKSPATQTVLPSLATATSFTPPPAAPALHRGAPLGSTAVNPLPLPT